MGVNLSNSGSSNNRVGGTAAADRNVISGNTVDGIQINGASNNLVQGNYIGTDVNGAAGLGNTNQGVAVFNGSFSNTIGGTAPGAGNLISGNGGRGISLALIGSNGNVVQGNSIGTNAAGTAAIPNATGITIEWGAADNTIGGTSANAGNLIAFNTGDGIHVLEAVDPTSSNAIMGNAIHSNGDLGIDLGDDGVTPNDAAPDGDPGPNTLQNHPVLTAAMTNGTSATFAGSLAGAASTTYRIELFANATPNPSFREGQRYLGFTNITTDAAGNGIIYATLAVSLTAGERVTATATDPSNNTSEFGNALLAVGNLVVTTTADGAPDGDTSSVSNLIANPGAAQRISLREAITAANNTPGPDTITFGIPITESGHVYYQDNGGAGFAAPTQTKLADQSTPSSPVISNYDADYPSGTARSWYRITLGSALPSITSPVTLDATTQPLSGAGAGPVIELVAAGYPGVDLQSGSSGSTIRGLCIRGANAGVRIEASSNNVVAGNFQGTNIAGTAAGPGNVTGVYIGANFAAANNNRVGGTVPSDRNLLSGNTVDGLQLDGTSGSGTANNLVQGNFIGVDVTGTLGVGNTNQGVALFGTNANNTIGGTAPGAGNVISGNGGHGLHAHDAGTTGTLIQGNKIGTNAAGTAAIGNGGMGVHLYNASSNTTVGGTAANAGNLIAFNGGSGVGLAASAGNGNSILGNSIRSNGGLGIDLNEDGVTANDAFDSDPGPNGLLNYPLMTAVTYSGGNLTLNFKLDVAAGSYRVEFFKNPGGADPSLFGEGEVFAGSTNITHPGGGAIFFNHTLPGNVGDRITATTTACTDGATCAVFGDTSEFARYMAATTAVTLQSFSAVGRDRTVDLSWTTASELQNLGFHLYRADAAEGPYTRITASLIPGLGSSPTGQSYAYRDGSLANDRTYFYKLEDVETTGVTALHGPVSATPKASSSPTDPAETAHGDPDSVGLREIERSAGHVILELRTGGFLTTATADGHVRLRIPGFESASAAGEPSLPMRRAFAEAAAGYKVLLTAVSESDVEDYPGLRPTSEGARVVETGAEGSVAPAEQRVAEGPAFRRVFPSEAARLEAAVFQGETKKAAVLLFPLRWNGTSLRLAKRLLVRLDFAGREERETPYGGSRGRRAGVRARKAGGGVVAQLTVGEPGLYRVDFEELFPARTRRGGTPVSTLRLSRQGESVPFHVEPEGAMFRTGSSLYFPSERSASNPYGDVVYELETNASGLLMDVARTPEAAGELREYLETLEKEENHYYQAGLLEAPDLWLWDIVVSPDRKSYPFAVDHVSATGRGRIFVNLQGASDFDGLLDHHVRVGVNGTVLGEDSWDGKRVRSLEAAIPPGLLREGENTLDIENVGDAGAAYSMVLLDRLRVEYARGVVARDGQLMGRFEESGLVAVKDLSGPPILLDMTERPRWLKGVALSPSAARLPVEAGRSYLVTSIARHPRVHLVPPSTLRSAANRADYLLVAPRAFLAAAQPLLERRQSEGLATRAVPVEEIYEQFGHGEAGPDAIKAFLEHAYQAWARPSPRYVLLLGDASYDPKNYLGTGAVDWIPGHPVKTSYLWTVSDPAYASVNGEDLIPDVAVGRLPASSVLEAERLVEKVLAFEDGGGDFAGRAVLVADNADAAGNFEGESDEIASTVLAGRSVEKIYYSREGATTRARIVSAFDAGASFLSYVGHGGTVIWASENFFNRWDVASLAAQSRQPFLMTMNCLNGFFQFPASNSLGEELVKAEGRGAIAAFSPSGLSLDEPAHRYHRAVLQEILSGRHARLGDAILAAQEIYAGSGSFPELLSIYQLLGDPALRIR